VLGIFSISHKCFAFLKNALGAVYKTMLTLIIAFSVQKAVDKLEKVVKYLTNITVALNGLLNITNTTSSSNITGALLVCDMFLYCILYSFLICQATNGIMISVVKYSGVQFDLLPVAK
jgi:hypothetical protein